ncbi:Uncharacterized protein Rs2_35452 [Raphanus sativus]|nr:Uncharacterized protein Rs2_35452 [Raphanus sativus]
MGIKEELGCEFIPVNLVSIVNGLGSSDLGFGGGWDWDGLRKRIRAQLRGDSKNLVSMWRIWKSGWDWNICYGKIPGNQMNIDRFHLWSKRYDFSFHIRCSDISLLIWVFPRLIILKDHWLIFSFEIWPFLPRLYLLFEAALMALIDLANHIWKGLYLFMGIGSTDYLFWFRINKNNAIVYLRIDLECDILILVLGVFISLWKKSAVLSHSSLAFTFIHFWSQILLLTFGFFGVGQLTMSQSQWITKSGGKMVEVTKPRIKISVPRFDNTEIIAQYAKTLIGRCMNPPSKT